MFLASKGCKALEPTFSIHVQILDLPSDLVMNGIVGQWIVSTCNIIGFPTFSLPLKGVWFWLMK